MKFRNHYVRRSAHPCDRHKRAVAYRHVSYVHSSNPSLKEILPIQTVVSSSEESKKVEKPVSIEKPLSEKTQETAPVKLTRKERKASCRKAEVDALLNRKRYSLKEQMLHPYRCMVNEAQEEIPASFLSSVLRILIKWIVISMFMSVSIKHLINADGLNFLHMNFSNTATLTFMLTLLGVVCEGISYLLNWAVCLIQRKGVSFARICAVGSMSYACVTVGFIVSGLFVLKSSLAGFLLMSICILFDMFLRHNALGKCTECSKEIQGILFAISFILEIWCFVYLFGMTLNSLIEMLVKIYL